MARHTIDREVVMVKPALHVGASVWLLVLCPEGHLLRSIRRGAWADARKKYGHKDALIGCGKCAQ